MPRLNESKHELIGRISVNPEICFGKPCIRGHRIWGSLILDMLAFGASFEEIIENYPGITETDIRACIVTDRKCRESDLSK